MSHIVRSERTSRLPACLVIAFKIFVIISCLNCYSFTILLPLCCVRLSHCSVLNTGTLEYFAQFMPTLLSGIGRCLAGGHSWRLIAAVGGKTRPICSCQFYLLLRRKPAKSSIRRSSSRSRTKRPAAA